MADWRVGQRVVCVQEFSDATALYALALGVALPRKGAVYRIRRIVDGGASLFLLLEEIVNPRVPTRTLHGAAIDEPGFAARAFRPIVEDRTQFALLAAIADRAGRSERAGA